MSGVGSRLPQPGTRHLAPAGWLFLLVLLIPAICAAESGEAAWLRYARLTPALAARYESLPATVVLLGDSPVLQSAQSEIVRGIRGMLGRTLRQVPGVRCQDVRPSSCTTTSVPKEPVILLGTIASIQQIDPQFHLPGCQASGVRCQDPTTSSDAYAIRSTEVRGRPAIVITSATDRGVLYGAFAFLRGIAQGKALADINEVSAPSAPVRWVNQWDNLDGSIERGYGGRSIFFQDRHVRADLTRASEYARLLASIGVNGCDVSNVNADLHILDPDFIPQLARIADVFRPWGVRLAVAVNVSMPKTVGGLDTFDPLDARVADWWKRKFDDVYKQIPDFGGVVVKADSEGQLGPSVYGRNPAEAANVIARALQPHGGIVFYRAFVYNHHLDWNDPKADRARAAYDIFHPLDGQFNDNVIIQIKYGPIDFQVREPVSPLFDGLPKTNTAIELQITQEYMGQQRHTVYLAPLWKEVLDFNMCGTGCPQPVRVKNIVSGRSFHRPLGGYVGVANVGLDADWLGNHLALANLYAFGRLAWNPDLTPAQIVDEWTRQTFSNDAAVVRTVSDIQLSSWPAYEDYTGPLGLQTLTNITGPHYGPAPESQERNGWGQWIRAEHDAVGMDRTVATGTGFAGQYSPAVRKQYESVATTPDNLVLFFHHLPYTYKLHNGKTVIQTIYDDHYQGAERVGQYPAEWKSLRGKIDDDRYAAVLVQLEYQAGHAIVWRDAIDNWFYQLSGIADDRGRVGHHPHRIEAEAMELTGYEPFAPASWEGASGGKGVTCSDTASSCSAATKFTGQPAWYEIDVEYFDLSSGVSHFKVFVGDQLIDEWPADMLLPGRAPSADSSVRHRIPGIALRPGDVIRIEATPDGSERAPLDYLEILPQSQRTYLLR